MALLRGRGLFGFIIPNNLLRTTVYDIVRKQILENVRVSRIVDLKAGVFPGVTASTIILLMEQRAPGKRHQIEVIDNMPNGGIQDEVSNTVPQLVCLDNPSYVLDIFTSPEARSLIRKISKKSVNLDAVIDVRNGIATHKNMAGILEAREDENSKPILFGRDLARYHYTYSGKFVRYIRAELLRPRDESIFLAPKKLVMQRIGGVLVTAYDIDQYYTFNSVNNLLPKEDSEYDLKFILGILNSKLMRFYYSTRFTNRSTLTVNISKTFLDQLPLPVLVMNDANDQGRHNDLVALVDRIISIADKVYVSRIPEDKALYQRQFEATDAEINRLTYELYGLTEDEITIVEQN